MKKQPYSLLDMLAGDESVDQFVGGAVYQAFLSATNCHRWHSPVAGIIVRAFVQPGTYYSEADDPQIGLVAFVPVGMADVSSCMIDSTITPGRHVAEGDELGYFQFGWFHLLPGPAARRRE